MKIFNKIVVFVLTFTLTRCNEPELPPCPTNIQFLPQNLPMHCRMPREVKFPGPLGAQMLQLPPFFQTAPPADKLPNNPPMPFPPGLPAPVPMPLPMMPIPAPPSPASKLPVIVMPFYSPETSHKNTPHDHDRPRILDIYRRPRPLPHRFDTDISSDTDTSSDTDSGSSSDGRGWWKSTRGFKRSGRRFNRRHKVRRKKHSRRDLLTPVLQYVTKDGYVIYEKRISKNEAKDWLGAKKGVVDENEDEIEEDPNNEVELQEPVEEFSEAETVTKSRGKSREELLEIITQKPAMHKHRPFRMKAKKHRRAESTKEDDQKLM